jgi:hypothetical protein
MSDDLLRLITSLRMALERIERKAAPLLATTNLLETEEGEDRLDVIRMPFVSTGEALKRLEQTRPGLLFEAFPRIDWKGRWVSAMCSPINPSIWMLSKSC